MNAELLRAATGCSAADAERFAGPLTAACALYGIDTPVRQAAFLAQIGHESGSLRHTVEVWGPTPAQRRYEGRADLGNTQPGDGERFRGHGLIQITGRFNHARVRDRLRRRIADTPDFEAEPHRLAEPQWAALSAADYWDDRGLNALADAGDFELLTRRINGGLNGYDDRVSRWKRAQSAFASHTQPEDSAMPIPAILGALLPVLTNAVPEIVKLVKPGSESAQANAAVASKVFEVAKDALGAANEQEVAERVAADPQAAKAVREAVQTRWFELAEAGGGGIAGARQADAETRARGDLLQSPSLWIGLMLLPLVYLLVGSLIGLVGSATWSDDVRAGLAGSIVSSIIGGLVGYYFGQTTSRNRTPAP